MKQQIYTIKKNYQLIYSKGYLFNDIKGFWVTKEGIPCMEDGNFSKPTSKKCDVETGEDQKGE